MAEGSGALRFFRPDGEPIPAVPEPPALPADPPADLVRRHRRRGIDPGAWTATPLWQGETLDLGLAIDMLRGLGGGRGPTDPGEDDWDGCARR